MPLIDSESIQEVWGESRGVTCRKRFGWPGVKPRTCCLGLLRPCRTRPNQSSIRSPPQFNFQFFLLDNGSLTFFTNCQLTTLLSLIKAQSRYAFPQKFSAIAHLATRPFVAVQ